MSDGSVYLRGKVWWIQFYFSGQRIRKSTGFHNKSDAKRMLRAELRRIDEGRSPFMHQNRVKFDDLAEDVRADYIINDYGSLDRLNYALKPLLREFSGYSVNRIDADKIKDYTEKRKSQGVQNGTINRELSALKRALNLGRELGKVYVVPSIRMLSEASPREGFFEKDDFDKLIDVLPEYLKAPIILLFHTGMRRRELFNLTWQQVSLSDREIRLEAKDTKNGEPRDIPLSDEAFKSIEIALSYKDENQDLVFHHNGKKIKDMRTAWKSALEKAKINKNLLPHDFRRTAVRNLSRAGVPDRIVMSIIGHKTRAIYDRYNIVSGDDLRQAAIKMNEFNKRNS